MPVFADRLWGNDIVKQVRRSKYTWRASHMTLQKPASFVSWLGLWEAKESVESRQPREVKKGRKNGSVCIGYESIVLLASSLRRWYSNQVHTAAQPVDLLWLLSRSSIFKANRFEKKMIESAIVKATLCEWKICVWLLAGSQMSGQWCQFTMLRTWLHLNDFGSWCTCASDWLIGTLVGPVQFAFLSYLLLYIGDCDLPVARAGRAKKEGKKGREGEREKRGKGR